MKSSTSIRALCAAAVFGLGFAVNDAGAADLKLKAPPPPAPEPLDIHGFFDISFKNDYITPRGLLVSDTGLTTQVLMGLVWDVWKNPGGFIKDISFNAGVWNDLWSKQGDFVFPPGFPNAGATEAVGSWNEFDWWFEGDIGLRITGNSASNIPSSSLRRMICRQAFPRPSTIWSSPSTTTMPTGATRSP